MKNQHPKQPMVLLHPQKLLPLLGFLPGRSRSATVSQRAAIDLFSNRRAFPGC